MGTMTDTLRAALEANLKAIIIRCTEGDKRSDWLPVIENLACEALAALSANTGAGGDWIEPKEAAKQLSDMTPVAAMMAAGGLRYLFVSLLTDEEDGGDGRTWRGFCDSTGKEVLMHQIKLVRPLASSPAHTGQEGAMREVLRKISIQSLSTEYEAEEAEVADFEGAYDTIVKLARATLASSPVQGPQADENAGIPTGTKP